MSIRPPFGTALGIRGRDYAAVAAHGEVITNSALLRAVEWPEVDPTGEPVRSPRRLDAELRALVLESAVTPRFSWERFLDRHRADGPAERLLALLNHRAFQFNSRAAFGGAVSPWRARVEACVREGRRLEVVLPAFCVIGNPVKRFDLTAATAAEDVALLHLANLAELLGRLHEPGAVFHIISDSTFYGSPFGVTSVEAVNYVAELRERIRELDLGRVLRLHDMSDVLQPVVPQFQRRFDAWFRALRLDRCADGISADEHDRWLTSMMASIDIRKLGLSYAELRATYLDRGEHFHGIRERARWALNEYRAMKLAATDLEWEELAFPGAVRATIHTKSIPVLGLRIFPEYKFSARLLPYHGIGVLSRSVKTGRYRMGVRPEMFVHGRPDMRRIVDERGITSFYLHCPQ
ncbi:L-tyrosine/L-tryptophan isonitrile synthase family protein [Actinokineospora spheciospongiae]|uniref:L-tyrosine/L-tryptophan isonitrile synthase family protein n=1 Tax=Actinokineospora spheciospongiae TaxID=909613 RepID=UPI00190F7B09|nr:L-tyrosine/L-tryptophan isonitrile synthase family protein [Actinokineospora spheciospongiae]